MTPVHRMVGQRCAALQPIALLPYISLRYLYLYLKITQAIHIGWDPYYDP